MEKLQMVQRQAVILAAGQSSRFEPLNSVHKAAHEMCGKPIIYWTMDSLVSAGIEHIIVVINPRQDHLEQLIRQYDREGVEVSVGYQPDPRGMADALLSVRELLADSFILVNAAQVKAAAAARLLLDHPSPVVLLAQDTNTPELYGVVTSNNGLAERVLEKPTQIESFAQRIIGIYKLSAEFVSSIPAGSNSQYLLEETLDTFVQHTSVPVITYHEQLSSLKYVWHLLDLKQDILCQLDSYISLQANVHPTALIDETCTVEEGAVVGAYAVVEGGCYIGRNAVVGQHCIVRKYSLLEEGAQVQRQAEVANSILMAGCSLHSGFIGDSVIGPQVKIGAGFVTANKRFDRQTVHVLLKNQKISTGRVGLGVMIGAGVNIGIHVGTMPGAVITAQTIVQPGTIVK